MSAIKNAMLIIEKNSNAHITILFRDIQASGTVYEKYYRKAREMGILFINYLPEKPPVIKKDVVDVYSDLLNQDIKIPQDLV
ncbi:unnamed protein product, partial [marine sediment metagenome]